MSNLAHRCLNFDINRVILIKGRNLVVTRNLLSLDVIRLAVISRACVGRVNEIKTN